MAERSHIPSGSVTVPDTWTVEQAEAVLDFLYVLEAAVFNAYERPLIERATREASGPHPVDVDRDLVDIDALDDSIPF